MLRPCHREHTVSCFSVFGLSFGSNVWKHTTFDHVKWPVNAHSWKASRRSLKRFPTGWNTVPLLWRSDARPVEWKFLKLDWLSWPVWTGFKFSCAEPSWSLHNWTYNGLYHCHGCHVTNVTETVIHCNIKKPLIVYMCLGFQTLQPSCISLSFLP